MEAALIAWFAVFTFMNGGVQSFWADELSSVGYVKNGLSLKEMFETYLFLDTNLPLYSLILYFWYRITPYGEQFLLIPSILFSIGGIVFFAKTAKLLRGDKAELIAFFLGCSSGTIIWQGAWEARCYSLVFLLSAFTMWAYANKVMECSKKNLIVYGVACCLFLWTHWFACILLAFYGIADLALIIRKKASWKTLLCYPAGLIIYMPWLVVSFFHKQEELASFWIEAPEWKEILWTVLFYVSGRRVLWYLCLITGVLICAAALRNLIKKKEEGTAAVGLGCVFTLSIGWVIGIVYVYSRYINPQGSLFLDRYFMVIAPQILLVTTWGLDAFTAVAAKAVQKCHLAFLKKMVPALAGGVVFIVLCGCFIICYREAYISIRKPREEYRQLSDYLISEGRLWDGNTALAGDNTWCVMDGFVDYYLVKRGYDEPANVINAGTGKAEENRFYKNYRQWSEEELLKLDRIYCVRIHMGYDDAWADFLEEHYNRQPVDDSLGVEVWDKKTK